MSFFDRFFGRNPKELFLNFDPKGSKWRVVSWNFDLSGPAARQWSIEIQGERNEIIQWDRQGHETVRFVKDSQIVRKKKMATVDPELTAQMNIAIHSTLKFAIESNHRFMLAPVTGATTQDFQNEARYLQWIQATFGTLSRALESMKKDPNLILTGACFSGTVPDTGEEVLRLIAFNLDIFFYLRPDQTLQIVVFDDKNLGHGESKAPSFQQIIKVTKPQFYDEITRLIHLMAQVGEIR